MAIIREKNIYDSSFHYIILTDRLIKSKHLTQKRKIFYCRDYPDAAHILSHLSLVHFIPNDKSGFN